MFRDRPSKKTASNFGAGSFVVAGNDKYLVIAIDSNCISLVDLDEMILRCEEMKVDNIYHLSEAEARSMINLFFPMCTFSDFEFITKGLK